MSLLVEDVPVEKCFWINNGSVCRNIYELRDSIKALNNYYFVYHVNSNKNDFAIWIREVLGDEVLAKRLESVKDKDLFVDIISQRIKDFE
jgi:hypothetical protein